MTAQQWFEYALWLGFAVLTAGPCLWVYVATAGPHRGDGN